jgi:oligopeptide/dipeptide ABC transporter ATP-binding protein
MTPPLLAIRDLGVRLGRNDHALDVLDGVGLQVAAGECLAVVGESGAGKSQLIRAVIGLSPPQAELRGSVLFEGQELLGTSAVQSVRGARIGVVFQDPAGALAPHLTVGRQLCDALRAHRAVDASQAMEMARLVLERVRIPQAGHRLGQYPHQLSGGLRQRVTIAAALIAAPALLLLDEPTTALDTTVQQELLTLFASLKRELNLAILLVSHDLGVVAGIADRVAVLYAGRIVEQAAVDALYASPRHPYTRDLLAASPTLESPLTRPRPTVPGRAPDRMRPIAGCAYSPRCSEAAPVCAARPDLTDVAGRAYACHRPLPVSQ